MTKKTNPFERRVPLDGFRFVTYPGGGWFRLFGVGLCWKDTRQHPLMFSERNGYTRYLMIGPWSIKWLSKDRSA